MINDMVRSEQTCTLQDRLNVYSSKPYCRLIDEIMGRIESTILFKFLELLLFNPALHCQ